MSLIMEHDMFALLILFTVVGCLQSLMPEQHFELTKSRRHEMHNLFRENHLRPFRRNNITAAHLWKLQHGRNAKSSALLVKFKDLAASSSGIYTQSRNVLCREGQYRSAEDQCMPCQPCLYGEIISPCQKNKNTVCGSSKKVENHLDHSVIIKRRAVFRRSNEAGRSSNEQNHSIKLQGYPQNESTEKNNLQSNMSDDLPARFDPTFLNGLPDKMGHEPKHTKNSRPPLNDIQDVPYDAGPRGQFPKPAADSPMSDSSKNGGIANWVLITIGATVAVVALSVFFLSYMYRSRVGQLHVQRKQVQKKNELEKTSSLLRIESQQDNLSLQSQQDIPLQNIVVNPCPDEHLEAYDRDIVDTERCRSSPQFLTKCLRSMPEEYNHTARESTGSIYGMIKNDGNKLRGGNGDFQRRYVENPYVSKELNEVPEARAARKLSHLQSRPPGQRNRGFNLPSSSSESGWNGSTASSTTSHHSARSYISIPPTSPSDNYIEAGFDCKSLHSGKSSPPVKMEWLTKSISLDPKNVLSTYQASTGVQTEDTVSPPTSKTFLGTPWQFGGAFNSKGGVLQARKSDVVLSVPSGAVSKGQAVDIYGAIFTDTAEIRRKLEFPNIESLVTPVVEYLALPVNDFSRPLHLHLPHSLPAEFDIESVKVYTFSVDELGRVSTSCLSYRDQSYSLTNTDAYWEKSQDGSRIIITTSHFSGYFCTLCKSTSLPSICTMIFGSHVQISQHRREIRIILYIWDRRLTIRDYLERFQKQESEVDRQLLTDMQVPLLNNASSDSRLVMRMEIMGSEEDRQCWRHVARPGGSRLLFKPLQVRRLSEIVQCCRQTDPIRVEWALENHPDATAGPIFQCCIDIMHAPESTYDYETALSEDLDDLMRTYYVRDLKVVPKENSESPQMLKFEPANLKRTLSEALDLRQTEQLCLELGITSKDIGNFHKKFSSDIEVQVQLVEECQRRLDHEKLISLLPQIFDKMCLSHLAEALKKEGCEKPNHGEMAYLGGKSAGSHKNSSCVQDSSLTACKYFDDYGHGSFDLNMGGSNKSSINTPNSPGCIGAHRQHPAMQLQAPMRTGNVFIPGSPSKYGSDVACGGVGLPSSLNAEAPYSNINAARPPRIVNSSLHHGAVTNNKLDSSSGYQSVNHRAILSVDNLSLNNDDPNSVDNASMQAQADTLEAPESNEPSPDRRPASQMTLSVTNNKAYPEIIEELLVSSSGPEAIVSQRLEDPRDSNRNDDKDQTFKKERYCIHTEV
ncbi:hypothetical protein PoB_006845100 [Plakobranchus ocellatus]|uniref:Netrin receptor UNC5 n=1 Tax=Plakobranchus ocellatus TaxID=259542 RepID=A0AAV4DCZ9_9GAST|nr:hypothetical protein PoB_006845100 [Plakobranchus ocellatus]